MWLLCAQTGYGRSEMGRITVANHWTEELLEYSTSKSPLRWEMTEERIEVGHDGTVEVPRGPGLGVHLNERTVEKFRIS